MHRKTWLVVLLALVFAIGMIGCAGEDGAQGPEGPAGEPGQNLKGYTYIGGGGEDCAHCHGEAMVTSYETTHHSEAYADLGDSQSNPYCVQCHTTGWDATVNHGDTTIVNNDGPDMYGFDNYFQVEGDNAAARRAALENVQCESCHGPIGNEFGGQKEGFVSVVTLVAGETADVSPCAKCHAQFEEYATSGHSNFENMDITAFQDEFGGRTPSSTHLSSCVDCHTSEGFVAYNDADWDFADLKALSGNVNLIGCATCHDPHGNPAGEGTHQLRTLADVTLAYDGADTTADQTEHFVVTGHGNGQLCMNCHQARRNNSSVDGAIANGGSHFGPHSSPQTDMFAGHGCYEIAGDTYNRTHAHQSMTTNGCVDCHMDRMVVGHSGNPEAHAGHDFHPVAWLAGDEVGACEACHTNLTENTFDINGFQTEVDGKMIEIAAYFDSNVTDDATLATFIDENGDSAVNGLYTAQERESLYALFFVYNDGSKGVHNPNYATSILDNAKSNLGL